MLIQVFHNSRRDEVGRATAMMDGYQASDPLTHVFDLELTEAEAADINWPDRVYDLLNIGDDPAYGTPDDRAVAYRLPRNRSLSVGDVLVAYADWPHARGRSAAQQPETLALAVIGSGADGAANGVALAVASFDFESVRVNPGQVVNALHHGTTPIGWPLAPQDTA